MWYHLSHARVLKLDKLYIYIALLLYIEHCFTKVKILHFIYIYIYIYILWLAYEHALIGSVTREADCAFRASKRYERAWERLPSSTLIDILRAHLADWLEL